MRLDKRFFPAAALAAFLAASPCVHANPPTLELGDIQMKSMKVAAAMPHRFSLSRDAVGNIAFNDERTVQVFTPYQGRIIFLARHQGDAVRKGETLYAIDSPDLAQAESAAISAAGLYKLTTDALERAKALLPLRGIAQKDYQQAVSDQQGAEGAYRAARQTLRIFGKSDGEIDRIVASRRVDSRLNVACPLDGKVTVVSRSAAIGTLVQPGNPPAPYTVSDLSALWMIANVAESDLPLIRLGEEVDVKVMAYPGRIFRAKVDNIGVQVDPNTHRAQVRCVIRDPGRSLQPGMFASFSIRTGGGKSSVAVPEDGVVREADGSMSVWVTTDRRHFSRRKVRIGVEQDGFDQILEGLKAGELVATEGAIFMSNAIDSAH